MSLSTNHKVAALRSAILAAVTFGLMLAPASAQADPVIEGGCRAQLTGQPGQPNADFTIQCQDGVQGLEFQTSEGVFLIPPVVQPSSGNPSHGFPCGPAPGGTPDSPRFRCQSGSPSPPGSPGLSANETGTITMQGQDPCGQALKITELIVDTGAEGEENSPPDAPEEDVVYDRDIRVQCEGENGGGGDGGDRNNDAAAAEECPDGSFRETEHTNEDRTTGEPEGEHRDSSFEISQDCLGNPRGGVAAGLGGAAKSTEVKAASVLPPIIGGSALVLVGLTTGGLALARRR